MFIGGMDMDVEIIGREKNPVVGREEVEFKASEITVTPSRKELRAKLAALLNAKEDAVLVRSVRQIFGCNEATGQAVVYETAEQLKKIEHEYLVNRNLGIKKAPAEQKEEAPKAKAKK